MDISAINQGSKQAIFRCKAAVLYEKDNNYLIAFLSQLLLNMRRRFSFRDLAKHWIDLIYIIILYVLEILLSFSEFIY